VTTTDCPIRRVLVIEDDGLIAMHISDTLDGLGYVVIGPARTVDDALGIIENETIDFALLDVNLGNKETSFPVADVLSRHGVPFAFLTGYGEMGLNGRFPGRPVISKPIDERHLARMLLNFNSN
jgi:DNA-binding response OmpR family regulator